MLESVLPVWGMFVECRELLYNVEVEVVRNCRWIVHVPKSAIYIYIFSKD